jgi:hypothetical protein
MGDIGEWGHEFVRFAPLHPPPPLISMLWTGPNPHKGLSPAKLESFGINVSTKARPLPTSILLFVKSVPLQPPPHPHALKVPYHAAHNVEHEACDLLIEVENLDLILDYVDDRNFARVCLYLLTCANYIPEPEDRHILTIVYQLYTKVGQHASALRVAIKLGDKELVHQLFESCTDKYPSQSPSPHLNSAR